MKKTILSLMFLGAAFAVNAQDNSDLSGNIEASTGDGYTFDFLNGGTSNGYNDTVANCIDDSDIFNPFSNTKYEMTLPNAESVAVLNVSASPTGTFSMRLQSGNCNGYNYTDLTTAANQKIRAYVKASAAVNFRIMAGVLAENQWAVVDGYDSESVAYASLSANTWQEVNFDIPTTNYENTDYSTELGSVLGLNLQVESASESLTIEIDWIEIGSDVGTKVVSGVQQIDASSINVYPNPASSVANVSYEGDAADVTVSDITGNAVASATGANGSATVDVSGLSSGVYVVSISTDGGVATKKLVVE